MHLEGLKEVVTCFGGISELYWLQRDMVVFVVVRVAANTRTRECPRACRLAPGALVRALCSLGSSEPRF